MSDTITVPTWVARLAAELLREYGDRLSNDGCNDYDPPKYVPVDELAAMMPAWNNEPDMSIEDAKNLCGYNWAVVGVVAKTLHQEPTDAH